MLKKTNRSKAGFWNRKSRFTMLKSGYLSNKHLNRIRNLSISLVAAGIPVLVSAEPLPVPSNPADSRVSTDMSAQSLQVHQNLSREVFDWQEFNISHGYRVDFNQPSASAIALNRIHQNDPSRIFGELNANGQVYLLNTNGFVFGNGSSVNTNTLIATTQDISNSVLERGVTQVFAQDGSAALEKPLDANGNPLPMGDIIVENGASITAEDRGQIILAAPKVVNSGTLTAKDGQVILAGSQGKVYLVQPDSSSGVRGLLVEVDVGGEATNLGELIAGNGNATMIGFAVNQKGRISATTTVDFDGQIRLLAREGGGPRAINSQIQLLPSTTQRTVDLGDGLGTKSKVTFGTNSQTRIDPDSSGGSAIDGQAQPVSSIQVMGHQIEMEAGSSIVAPSGDVEMIATNSPINFNPNILPPNKAPDANRSTSLPEPNDTSIILAGSSKIDVSGTTNTVLPMERNVVSVRLTDNELRDSPLQKGQFLDRKTIRVDTRIGTPIADISAEVAKISRPLSERTSTGGTVSIVSEGNAVIHQGSVIDISGGSVTFEDGFINTTRLITDDGRVVSIGEADPSLRYVGILGQVQKTYEKWAQTLTWVVQGFEGGGSFEPGYIQGQAAGVFELIAPRVALDGDVIAGSLSSQRQRELGNLAFGGELHIDLARNINARQSIRLAQDRHSALILSSDNFLTDPMDPVQPAALELDNRLFGKSGLSKISLINNGQVRIENSSDIRLLPGSAVSIDAGSIEMAGTVDIHSGSLELKTHATTSTLQNGKIAFQPSTRIDLSGEWVNDSPVFTQAGLDPIAIDGGTLKVSASGDLIMEEGSVIDVRGAARVSETNVLTPGRGGDVFLEASGPNGSNLIFESTVLGHSFDKGGTFSLASNQIIVSDTRLSSPENDSLTATIIDPDFLAQAGFGNYRLISNANGLTVDEGTQIRLVQLNRVFIEDNADRSDFISSLASGTDLNGLVELVERPQFERNPVNLRLELAQTAGKGPAGAAVNLRPDAVIRTDPGATVELISDGNINFDGIIEAPSGTVDLTITEPRGIADPGFVREQAIWLGANSAILAKGAVQMIPGPTDRRDGNVLSGGSVTINSRRGFVIFEEGALIDVSGTSAEFDLPGLSGSGLPGFNPVTVASDAGSIRFLTSEGAFLDGNLVGRANSAHGAAGGKLSVNIDPRRRGSFNNADLPPDARFPIVPVEIRIHHGNAVLLPADFERGGAVPEAFYALVEVNQSTLKGAGFESLNLFASDRISFDQGVSLVYRDSLILDTPRIQSSTPNSSTVNLSASLLQIGSSQLDRKTVLNPISGNARLQAHGNLIDLIGITALEGFNDVVLDSSGDIRMRGNLIGTSGFDFTGEFSVAGNLSLKADQIYPTTLSDFRISLSGASSALTVLAGGADTPVLSAGGRLSLNAPNIIQKGVLKAPFGTIDFNASNELVLAAGSKTSVSAEDQIIPFGRVQGRLNWVYPLTGNRFVVFDSDPESQFRVPPEKRIELNGADIRFEPSATIDADGGGDMFAFEVVRGGPGGSRDILDPTDPDVVNGLVGYEQKFAILAGFQADIAPYDPLESPSSGLTAGDSIFLYGAAGLAAGNYVLLPAHYALLPGAMLVTPVPGTQDIIPGLELTRIDGAPISAGYRFRSGTDNRVSRLSGFAVEAGTIARTRSDYIDYGANQFFTDQARLNAREIPRIPVDAGRIFVSTINSLRLGGDLSARAERDGRGGQLDIQAQNLSIVANSGDSAPGVVEIDANLLSQLDVASLLLGGSRNQTTLAHLFPDVENPERQFIGSPITGNSGTVTEIVGGSDSVTVGSGVSLDFAETILVAKDSVTIKSGAVISSASRNDRISQAAVIQGEAAVVRVTNDSSSAFARVGLPATVSRGSVDVENGAILNSGRDGAILVDAPFEATFDGTLNMTGGSLALSSAAIDIGQEVTQHGNALVLDQRLLGNLAADALYLNSLSQINLAGDFRIGSATLDLELGAARISGSGSGTDVFTIIADSFSITNRSIATMDVPSSGSGTLKVQADRVEFGDGNYSLDGFSRIDIAASSGVSGRGDSIVRFAADSTVTTPLWSAADNADTRIDAGGYSFDIVNTNPAGNSGSTATPGLGALLTVKADRMTVDSDFLLPSGKIDLTALNGDLNVQAGSMLDVHGSFVQVGRAFGKPIGFSTPAGDVLLSAETGNVLIGAGASINLSNQSSNNTPAGSLVVSAPLGRFGFDGQLNSSGGGGGSRFSVVADSLGQNGFSHLASRLSNSRFERIDIQQNSGDLAIGSSDSLSANYLTLEASTGSIDVGGTLSVSMEGDGGSLHLTAGDEIILGTSSSLLARGGMGKGGRIRLEAWDADTDGLSGLRIGSDSTIDLSGSLGGGELQVSVPRIDSNGDGQDDNVRIIGTLTAIGQSKTTVEAVRVYNDASIDSADIIAWRDDTRAFMSQAQGVLGADINIVPGIVVSSTSDLILNAAWNFLPSSGSADWRYDGLAGVLTLRAGGDIQINQSISDGFAPGTLDSVSINNLLQPDQSWSYQFKARGDFNLAADSYIRTGTGDIEVDAGGDINYGNMMSSIYTAGRQTTQTIAVDPNDPTKGINGNPLSSAQIANNPYGSFSSRFAGSIFYAEYPVDGGDVSLTAGGNINGVKTDQFINDWLVRIGNWNPANGISASDVPTAWGIAIDRPGAGAPGFRQSVGALGGGRVEINAGGNIRDLSVVLPTSGKQIGLLGPNADPSRGRFEFTDNQVAIHGGGELRVNAGRNIAGGLFYNGSGNSSITAGADIVRTNNNLGVLLAMDDAQIKVVARGDIALSGIFNPTALPGTTSSSGNLFFRYGPASEVELQSIGGDLVWNFEMENFVNRFPAIRFNQTNDLGAKILPPDLRFFAGRDIRIESGITQFPAPDGQLQLIAGRDITSSSINNLVILQSDSDPAFLANFFTPATNDLDAESRFNPFGLARFVHAAMPLHTMDSEPSLIAAGRDITNETDNSMRFLLAESAIISAGRDVTKTSFRIQNTKSNDTALIQAARDIRFAIPLNPRTGAVVNQQFDLEVAGPGRFYALAGRDLDLGASNGIASIGNLANPGLVDGGADITVLSGIQGFPDFTDFTRMYLEERSDYQDRLIEYVGGASTFSGALSAFKQLTEEERLPLILEIFYNEIREGGRKGASTGMRSDYARGDAAIAALLPDESDYHGNVRLFFSKIQTIDGEDINILAPGGEINAGLAVAFSGRKDPSQLGIVAQKSGDINIYVRDDLQVNSSRVATFGGGNILAWSNLGNIDAGRGARSSVTIPPPVTTINAQGQLETTFSPAVAVSGIQAATTRDGVQGNVDLFAPNGVIDAGLAGIAGADVTVGATAILNANNISFSRSSVGVPLGNTTSIAAGLTGASNLATTVGKIAESIAKSISDDTNEAAASGGFLKVEFLGYE
ncbi:MAG: filamentous hemagglutinin family protein [Methylococcales bacterium]